MADEARASPVEIAARRWLGLYQLPGYAPEPNPAENIWSSLKRSMANLAPSYPSCVASAKPKPAPTTG